MADIIRLARDRVIEDSRKDAILFLNAQDHIVGQQWQVRYYRDESQTEIDTLVAIGVRNGTGSECYRVISYGTATPVISITETLPDVSELVHGELYIIKIDGRWNFCMVTDDTRRFDPITGGPYSFFNLEDGHVWYYTEHNLENMPEAPLVWLRRDDNFYTREEIDEWKGASDQHEHEQDEELAFDAEWLKDLDNVTFPVTLSVTASPASTIWHSGTTHDITFDFKATKILRYGLTPDPKPETEGTTDMTSECKFYYKLSTESEYHQVAGSSVTLQGVTATNKTLTYNFKGGDIEKFGRIKYASNISYNFGYKFLYGVTSGTLTDIDSLSVSSLTMKSTYYSATYTTTLDNLATFAIPTDWGDITKITDSGGVMNYTTSFSKIGTFTRTIEGQSVRYNVWRWTSLPTVATGFTYRFYN
jgi:hypothetical protein